MGNTQTNSTSNYSLMIQQKDIIQNEDGISTTFLLPSRFLDENESKSQSSSLPSTPRSKSNKKQSLSEPSTPRTKTSRSPVSLKTSETKHRKRFVSFSSFNIKSKSLSQSFERSKSTEEIETKEENQMTFQLESIINRYLGDYHPEVLYDTNLHQFESRAAFFDLLFSNPKMSTRFLGS